MARFTPEQRRDNKEKAQKQYNIGLKEKRAAERIANAEAIAARKESRRLARIARNNERRRLKRLENLELERAKDREKRAKRWANPESKARIMEAEAIRRAANIQKVREAQRIDARKRRSNPAFIESERQWFKERRAKIKNQTAADQFFIMMKAAEEISKILPKPKP